MFTRQTIGVGNLLLNVNNYRIVPQASQKAARDAIISEQGKKLVVLAKDIVANGLSPFDLPMVVDAQDGNKNFLVMEGNRRLTAIQLMLDPELCKEAPVHGAFVKLNKNHYDAIPKVIDCAIAESKQDALLWGNRKHASGLSGAGTEPWTAMAKARADADQGKTVPALDVVNFVLTNPGLSDDLRHHLEGAQFNLTTLARLVTTKELQTAAGFSLDDGTVVSTYAKDWTRNALTEVVEIIATGRRDGDPWTERDIDDQDKRQEFVADLITRHPNAKKTAPWRVTGKPTAAGPAKPKPKTKATPSTEEQANLIPKAFKLTLPSGKINDVFVELKKLDINTFRHAISVLFRVFLEISLDEYLAKHDIPTPVDGKGKRVDSLGVRLGLVLKDVKKKKLFTEVQLKPIEKAQSDRNSLLAPDTLNAYVHSKWMNPGPMDLKVTWTNVQPFLEGLWTSQKEKKE